MNKLEIIEADEKERFISLVNAFMKSRSIVSTKFQRNLYYSLSGSTHNPEEMHKETSHLKEGYVAFIVWSDPS